jgi:hypothetical protein
MEATEIFHNGVDLPSVDFFKSLLRGIGNPGNGVKLFLIPIYYKNGLCKGGSPALELALKLASEQDNRVILYGAWYLPLLRRDGGDALVQAEESASICFCRFPVTAKEFYGICEYLFYSTGEKPPLGEGA